MTLLKKLAGKTSLAIAAAAFAASIITQADTGGSSCSDAGGTKTCSGSDRACCIYGTDSSGSPYNIKQCCTGNKTCKVTYTDGSSGGGVVSTKVVDQAGCL